MPYESKTYPFIVITTSVLLLIFSFASVSHASYDATLQTSVDSYPSYEVDLTAEFIGYPETIETDTNGYRFINARGGIGWIDYDDFHFSVSPIPSGRLWLFATKPSGVSPVAQVTYYFGSAISTDFTEYTPFSVSGRTITPISYPDFFSSFSDFYDIDIQFGAYSYIDVYAMVFSDDDLSYVDSEEELYDLLDVFSASPTPPDTSTRWLGTFSPADGETTDTGDVEYASNYFYDTSTHDFSEVCALFEDAVSHEFFSECDTINENADAVLVGTITLPENRVYWYNAEMRGVSATLASDTVVFSTVSNAFPEYMPGYDPTDTYIADAECSISNMSGCFQNALSWAFFVPSSTWDEFGGMVDAIKKKPPFGYFYSAQDALENFDDLSSSSSAFTLETVDAISPVLDPLRLGVSFLVYILGLFVFVRIVSDMKI